MLIRQATMADAPSWAELRATLWREQAAGEHRAEIDALLAAGAPDAAAFVAVDPAGRIAGFAEAALRRDYVNGCETSPVAFLEGIFVRPADRKAGIARRLLEAVQAWARDKGCAELASDALLDNVASHAFHRASGFDETERVVYFRQRLD